MKERARAGAHVRGAAASPSRLSLFETLLITALRAHTATPDDTNLRRSCSRCLKFCFRALCARAHIRLALGRLPSVLSASRWGLSGEARGQGQRNASGWKRTFTILRRIHTAVHFYRFTQKSADLFTVTPTLWCMDCGGPGELSYALWGHGGRARRPPDGPDGLGRTTRRSPGEEGRVNGENVTSRVE